MSIGVGTLQPKSRVMRPVWLAGLLVLVLAITLAVIVTNSGEEPARDALQTETAISGTAANTPTELRYAGSAFSGTAANTPTELSGGIVGSFADVTFEAVPHLPRRNAEAESFGGTSGNTPSELSGGGVCHQCR